MSIEILVLLGLRLVLLVLSLGLTLISFEAYRQNGTRRLEYAFVGFACVSIGVAVTALAEELAAGATLRIAATVPFIAGFGALYASLYR